MFLINDAYAEGAAVTGQAGDPLMSFLPLIILFAIMYFLLIRPQIKRQKEHTTLINSLNKGDEVVTQSGVVGKIVDLSEIYATVEIASGVQVKMQRIAITTVLPKGTMKDI